MGKIIILYLFLGAVSEFFILLFVRGISTLQIDFWEWSKPDSPVAVSVLNALFIPKFGVVIPVFLLLLGIAYLANRIRSPKVGVHALGISIFLTSCIVFVSFSRVLSPMFRTIISMEMPQ